ncbi:MAG: hypothetical protein ABI811_19050 [Acidobacteriota bacterium]
MKTYSALQEARLFLRLKFGAQKQASAVMERSEIHTTSNEPQLVSSPVAKTANVATVERPRNNVPAVSPSIPPRGVPHIKTYRVTEMREAMIAARRELGDDAILIQSKRLGPAEDDGQRYEVTFGVIGAIPTPTPTIAAIPETAIMPVAVEGPRAEHPVVDPPWTRELRLLRQEMADLQTMLIRQYWEPGFNAAPGRRSSQLRSKLVQHGVDADLASDWALALEDATDHASDEEFTAATLAEYLRSRVQVDASLGWDASQGKAFMLVGPAASGKTTALLKLALEFGIKRGRPVEVWYLDSRGSGVDQITQSFTQLLNIPYRNFQSAATLVSGLAKMNLADRLILIDTNPLDEGSSLDEGEDLPAVLQGPHISCHLTLPATWHPAMLRRTVDRYEVFQPTHLLITMLDQACVFGSMLQEPWRTRKALSFISEGPLGPGQIRPASLEYILNRIDHAIPDYAT